MKNNKVSKERVNFKSHRLHGTHFHYSGKLHGIQYALTKIHVICAPVEIAKAKTEALVGFFFDKLISFWFCFYSTLLIRKKQTEFLPKNGPDEPVIKWKQKTGHKELKKKKRKKKTLELYTRAHDTVMWHWSVNILFWQLSLLNITRMSNIKLNTPIVCLGLSRCYISHLLL